MNSSVSNFCLIILLVISVISGCHKAETNGTDGNIKYSDVEIVLSAGNPLGHVTKAAVDEWNDNIVNVFGLKRKRGSAVGTGVYDFDDDTNIVDYMTTASSGKKTALEVYSDKDAKVPYHYTEGVVYDFYGYHLGGADASAGIISGDTYGYDVTFYGNNDLMYAVTDKSKDIELSGNTSVNEENVYSAWAARRDIHPNLIFRHALVRLNFIIEGSGDKWQNVQITGIDVQSVNKGRLTVTGPEVGFVADSDAEMAVLSLKTADDEDFIPEDVTLNISGQVSGGDGACIMIAPDMEEILVRVHMADKLNGNTPLGNCSFVAKAADVVRKDENGNAITVTSFEAGHSYDFHIKVYGPETIEIIAELTQWDDGGYYVYDPDTEPGVGSDADTDTDNDNSLINSEKYVNIDRDGETIEIKVSADTDYEVGIPSSIDWIRKVGTRSVSETSLCLEVEPNTGNLTRTANITITDKENNVSESIVVVQQGNKTMAKIAYSTDKEELEEWSEGLFGGDGTYVIGKPHGNGGYLAAIGNILEDESALVYLDDSEQIREIFVDNIVFAFEYNDGIDISVIESGREIVTEHVNVDNQNIMTRSSDDHGQEVGIINLVGNLQGMYDAIKEIVDNKGFSKKGTVMFIINKADSIRNLVRSLGGPDIFNETFSDWLGVGMNIVGIKELAGMYGTSSILGPIGAFLMTYAGLYATYLDLYDQHIEAFYGNCRAEISAITPEKNKLNIEVSISGYEPWYNTLECGVVVQEKSLLKPSFSDEASISTITHNGSYMFVESGIKVNTVYSCRPFVIDKGRASLWKGFIGDMIGPLVRYGDANDVEIHPSVSTGDCLSVEETAAVVKCSYTNVYGAECGVYVSSDDETMKFAANSTEGEQEVTLSGLRPATTYNYWAYVNVNGEYINGQIKSFTTDLPDVSGTWSCKEIRYTTNGEYYNSYTVTLHDDGTVTTSLYDDFYGASWSRSATSLFVRIDVIATLYSNSGYNLSITFDDPAHPNSGKGYAEQWNYNGMTGGSSSQRFELEMKR